MGTGLLQMPISRGTRAAGTASHCRFSDEIWAFVTISMILRDKLQQRSHEISEFHTSTAGGGVNAGCRSQKRDTDTQVPGTQPQVPVLPRESGYGIARRENWDTVLERSQVPDTVKYTVQNLSHQRYRLLGHTFKYPQFT